MVGKSHNYFIWHSPNSELFLSLVLGSGMKAFKAGGRIEDDMEGWGPGGGGGDMSRICEKFAFKEPVSKWHCESLCNNLVRQNSALRKHLETGFGKSVL